MTNRRTERGPAAGLKGPTVLGAVVRLWYLTLMVMMLTGVLGAYLASLIPSRATATAALLLEEPSTVSLFDRSDTETNYVSNQLAILGMRSTAELAVERLRARQPQAPVTVERLLADLEVGNSGDNDLVTIAFTDSSPTVAQDTVNSVVEAYQQIVLTTAQEARDAQLQRVDGALRQLEEQLEAAEGGAPQSVQATYDTLLARRAELSAEGAAGDGVEVVSPAVLPPLTTPLTQIQGVVLGALLGAFPGAALCYALAQSQRRLVDRFDPEAVTGVPLLSEVPHFRSEGLRSDVPSIDAPFSAAAEAFRFAATLLSVRRSSAGPVTAVISAASQDGKSTVTANLAITLAQSGKRVLAVDGDLSGRGLSFLLIEGNAARPGLLDVLEGTCRLEDVVHEVPLPNGEVLRVLPGGLAVDEAPQLLASSRCAELFESFREYDEVLVDVPPLLQVAYAASLTRASHSALFVVPHRSPVRLLEDLVERVNVLGAELVGYLYNLAPLRSGLGQHSGLVTDLRRRPRATTSSDPSSDADGNSSPPTAQDAAAAADVTAAASPTPAPLGAVGWPGEIGAPDGRAGAVEQPVASGQPIRHRAQDGDAAFDAGSLLGRRE